MKKSMIAVIGAALIGVSAMSFSSGAMAGEKHPYCTVASNSGGQWWTWTVKPMKKACDIAKSKIGDYNWIWKNRYDTTGLNKATLVCHRVNGEVLGKGQGKKKKVSGYGKAVFTNGLNMASQLGWKGCYLKVHQ